MHVVIIDNHDSFTGNIVEEVRRLGARVTVLTAESPDDLPSDCDAIIISPGPGTPQDIGLNAAALDSGLPTLGVCLGHQLIAQRCGSIIGRVRPAHAQISRIEHNGDDLFAGLPPLFDAVRYHSLAITKISPDLVVIARANDDETIQGIRHRTKPWWGVQFHPESAGATEARLVVSNFLEAAGFARIRVVPFDSNQDIPSATAIFEHLYSQERGSFFLDEPTGFTALGAGEPSTTPWSFSLTPIQAQDLPFNFRPGVVVALDYEQEEAIILDASRALLINGKSGFLVGRSDDPGFDTWMQVIKNKLTDLAIGIDQQKGGYQPPEADLVVRNMKSEYQAMIAGAQEHIVAGNTYEVCLTTQIEGSTRREWNFLDFVNLREQNRSPRGGYLRANEFQLLSTSPELFLEVKKGRVSSKPIKGTRSSTADPAELARNPKDRAENLMIVDLVRHDLTQVAVPGTVQVEEIFEVESYATVHQLVSTISAELAAGPIDAIRAAFPGGSMTGAPKESTMRIIQELEKSPRGYYSGAFGFLGADGSVQLTMTIRTIIARGQHFSYGIGGAILAMSDPEAEWEEIIIKATPLLSLLKKELST